MATQVLEKKSVGIQRLNKRHFDIRERVKCIVDVCEAFNCNVH